MLIGKGIYAWILSRCDNGDMARVAARLASAGMTHIIPKLADGISADINGNHRYLPNLVRDCHRAGIRVIPYHYVYGYSPRAEAERVITELTRAEFDGLIINAEHQYRDLANNAAAANRYCETIKQALPEIKLGLSTYRFPSLHSRFPFAAFLRHCEWNMPQVYWMRANGTVPGQLTKTIAEYRSFPAVTIIPTGAAFAEHGWSAIPEDQGIFVAEARRHGLAGCNWWEYHEAFHRNPELGTAIIAAKWDVETKPIPTPDDPAGQRYVIEMLGNLRIRRTPDGEHTGQFAVRGETHHSSNRAGGWYEITKAGVIGWIYAGSQWARVTEITEPPDTPPVNPVLTIEERLDRIEKHLGIN